MSNTEQDALLGRFRAVEQALESAQKQLGRFVERLPVMQEAYNLVQRAPTAVTPDRVREEWRAGACRSLKKLAAGGSKAAKNALGQSALTDEALAEALNAAIDEFYQPWPAVFEQARQAVEKACGVLPAEEVARAQERLHPHAIQSSHHELGEVLRRVCEFRETLKEQLTRDTPEGRRRRLEKFCREQNCRYEDVWCSAGVSKGALYDWLHGAAPRAGRDIERVLSGEIPIRRSGAGPDRGSTTRLIVRSRA